MQKTNFFHLKIYPVAGPDISDGYIVVEDGKIAQIGPGRKTILGAREVDCGARVVCPGFVDAHTHLGMWEDALGFEGEDGNEETDPCTPHLRAIDAVNVMDRGFNEALVAGVTTVVIGPGSANPIAGQMCAIKTHGRCIDDMIVKAPVAMKFAFGENPKTVYYGKQQSPMTRMGTAAIMREQLYKAKRYAENLEQAAEDENADVPDYDVKCEALLPLLRGEIPAHMHAHRADDIFTAMRIADEFSLRCVIVHGTQGHEVADLLAVRGARVITGPLMATRGKPELKALSDWGPTILSEAGVPIAICTDHPEVAQSLLAFSAAFAVEHGLDIGKALRAVTLTASQLAEISDRVGSLEVGKDADILFYPRRSKPISFNAHPDAVMIDGEFVYGELE